jgi:hypothetical protein
MNPVSCPVAMFLVLCGASVAPPTYYPLVPGLIPVFLQRAARRVYRSDGSSRNGQWSVSNNVREVDAECVENPAGAVRFGMRHTAHPLPLLSYPALGPAVQFTVSTAPSPPTRLRR